VLDQTSLAWVTPAAAPESERWQSPDKPGPDLNDDIPFAVGIEAVVSRRTGPDCAKRAM
jgi:hypothetical protein